MKIDELVKSRKIALSVIPAKAGIQSIRALTKALDSGFHRSDDFLRDRQNLSIEDIHVDMPRVPHEECDQTAESLQKLKGMRIVPGFTSKVKRLLGGKQGCLHLTTLVLAMAPAILQGFWAFRNRNPGSRKISSKLMENYLIDTCWVWRKDGPLAEQLFSSLSEK